MLQLLSNPSAIRSLSRRCSAPGCTQGQEQGGVHCAIAIWAQSDFAAGARAISRPPKQTADKLNHEVKLQDRRATDGRPRC